MSAISSSRGDQALAAIHDEHNDIRRLERLSARADDELVERILARAEQPAGIDERERRALPLGRLRVHVARRPGDRRDDRAARCR